METKICASCKEEKSISDFKKSKNCKMGIRNRCKVCCTLLEKKNKDMVVVRNGMKLCTECNILKNKTDFNGSREVYKKAVCIECANKKISLRIQKLKNRDIINIPEQKVCSKCKVQKNHTEFYPSRISISGLNSECKECDKAYRSDEKNKKRRVKNESDRRINDINYKLYRITQTRFHTALRKSKIMKSIRTLDIIGCSMDELKIHLESQFKKGMTWDNYGLKGWHIDHIRPCSSFDFTKEEEIRQCWHYTNLQPLWWWENLEKGGKWENTTSQ